MSSLRRLISALSIFLLATQTCGGQDSLELVPGDVTIGAMFSVNNIHNGGCGDYNVDSLKEMMAVKWFLDAINSLNYIPGVTIGLETYRTCQSGDIAAKNVVQMMERFRVLSGDTQDVNSTTPLLGVLGPDRTQEAIVVSRLLSSLPPSQRLLQVTGSATGATLSDRALYSNLFRVIPPDSTQVMVLLKLLQQLDWNYIAIVYDDDDYGRQAAEELRDLSKGQDLCVPSFTALPLDYRSKDFIAAVDVVVARLKGTTSSIIITGVVFIGNAATAKEFLGRLTQRITFVRFIFSEALGLQTSALSQAPFSKGALAAAPPYFPLPEFRSVWNSLWTNWTSFSAEVQRNPWLQGYYTATTSCEPSSSSCWTQNRNTLPLIQDDTQWFFEYYQVKAAAVFAATLKKLHTQTCGQGSAGVCLQLKQLIRNNRGSIQNALQTDVLDLEAEFLSVSSVFRGQTRVGFDEEGQITSGEHNASLYYVFNYRECSSGLFCFQQVGTYTVDGQLKLDTETIKGYDDSGYTLSWPDLAKAQCMDGQDCLECLPQDIPGEIVFVPGDFYIVAVAPVHDRVSNSPLQCGNIRKASGADFVHSVLFAVNEVNKKKAPFSGIFGSKTLGVVILNSCVRELVIKQRLIELHKGTLPLPDGRNSSAILPLIAGYVGAFFSTVSVAMYEVLERVDKRFVVLSPTNTSPELSDRSKYPLYLRLTPGQNMGAMALLSIVRDLGHQYVQVLYDPDDTYSAGMKESINALISSKAFNICVVNNIASDPDENSFYPILDNLRKNLWSPLVITALQLEHTVKVMNDILPQMASSEQFFFLGTDGWGKSDDLLVVQNGQKLVGSLTVATELPLNLLFGEDLRTTDPLHSLNPWLKYFWEEKKQCYFDGSFRRRDKPAGLCPQDLTGDYIQDPWVPFYIKAVHTFALGLDSAMSSHCGQAFLCDTLTSQQLVDAVRAVRLDLFNSGINVDVFDSNGDGDVGYKVYQVSYGSGGDLIYERVGRYELDMLTLSRNDLWVTTNLETSQCPNPKACNACFPPAESGASTDVNNESGSDQGTLIATIVVIVVLVIVIVVLVIFLVRAMRRLRARANEGEKFAFDNIAATQSADSSVHSRPLPPLHSNSVLAESSVASASGESGGSINTYDYLHHNPSDGQNTPRNSHFYHRPTLALPASDSSPTSMSREPSVNSAGYVTRDSDGHAPYELAGSVGGTQNSRVPGDSDGSRGRVVARPLVFENSSPCPPKRAPAPPPPSCESATCGSDYLTPISDPMPPTPNYVDMERGHAEGD